MSQRLQKCINGAAGLQNGAASFVGAVTEREELWCREQMSTERQRGAVSTASVLSTRITTSDDGAASIGASC